VIPVDHLQLGLGVAAAFVCQTAVLSWYTARFATRIEFKVDLMWGAFKKQYGLSNNGEKKGE
jgi:hypothetical protein